MRSHVAKLFKNGRSQAVRLPSEFRFEGKEVFIYREEDKVILSAKPTSWDDFFDSPLKATNDFMAERLDPPPESQEIFGIGGQVLFRAEIPGITKNL